MIWDLTFFSIVSHDLCSYVQLTLFWTILCHYIISSSISHWFM